MGDFDAGRIVGHMDMETGEFTASIEGVTKQTENMTKSMLGAQVQFALLEKGVRAVTGFLKNSMSAWIEQEDAIAQTEARLKSTGNAVGMTTDELVALSGAMQDQTTYADEEVLAMENLLLTFTKISGDIFPEVTATALDMSTALGQDLKSSAIQLGKALQDPVLGVTALRRVGVNFNEAQTEMIKKMTESGDLMGAQKYILKELQTEFGGAAAAAKGTFGGALKSLNNQLGEFQENIGQALAPVLQSLIDFAMPIVQGLKSIDASTIQLGIGMVAAGIAIFGAVKAFSKIQAAITAGSGPLMAVIAGFTVLIGVVMAVNEAFNKARTIHKELADQYVNEYNAIDGQVKLYEQLKNKTNLNSQEKIQLSKVENDLQTQLGESSLYLDEQSGKWTANATAVSKYKGERLAMAKAELAAQVVVQEKELKWAQERRDWFERFAAEGGKEGKASLEARIQYIAYGGDILDVDKGMLNMRIDLNKATDELAASQGALDAINNGGVATYKEYNDELGKSKSTIKNTAPAIQSLTDAENKEGDAIKKLIELKRELGIAILDGQAQEEAALAEKKRKYEEEFGIQKEITEWYNNEMAKIATKYAEDAATAWQNSIKDIVKTVQDVVGVVGTAWNAIEGVWSQALANEEAAMENDYAKKKAAIEATITDEEDKAAALEALDAEYAEKKKELQKKQWVAQQAGAITNAIMSTAQAVVSALAVFPPWLGIALAATVGALGAVQIGLIASQPMPEFAAGGMAQPGMALVGERGPELVRFADTAQVYSANDTRRILSGSGGGVTQNFYGPINSDVDMIRVNQMLGAKYRSAQVGAA